MNIYRCTFTGVDQKTSINRVEELSNKYPYAEWALLYSAKRQGNESKYPSYDFIADWLDVVTPSVHLALHLCGRSVQDLINQNNSVLELVELVQSRKGRIQLNFNNSSKQIDIKRLVEVMKIFQDVEFITQRNDSNIGVLEEINEYGINNHSVLFDRSGGKGIKRIDFSRPITNPCGYAGGLSADNLYDALKNIKRWVSENDRIWVDMESRIRITHLDGKDWLDLNTCQECLEKVEHFMWTL